MLDNLLGYLKIRSDHPNPDYVSCIKYLISLKGDLEEKVYWNGDKPILMLTKVGQIKELPALLLSSHMDVVPAGDEDAWISPPFDASIKDGLIYARGTQDMKSIGMAYLEALLQIPAPTTRTIHLLFTPDEEIGSGEGMQAFVPSLGNIAFALDEGCPSPGQEVLVFVGEKRPWWVECVLRGVSGHGSVMHQGTAIQKLSRALSAISSYQREHRTDLVEGVSVNVTGIRTEDTLPNVIPSCITVGLDVRVPPGKESEAKTLLDSWLASDWRIVNDLLTPNTISPTDTPLFKAIKQTLASFNLPHRVAIFPGATDARFIREHLGIPAYGFTPFNNTPLLLHDKNECLSVEQYERAILIYKEIIQRTCQ